MTTGIRGDNSNDAYGMRRDSSNLTKFVPRHAAVAAVSPQQQYRYQVKSILKQQQRRKLPVTQQSYYEQTGR